MEGGGGVGVSEEQHSRWTKLRRVRDDPGMSALLRQPEKPGRFIRYHRRRRGPGSRRARRWQWEGAARQAVESQ